MTAKVGVIGSGAWGTALAIVAQRAGCDTVLWTRDPDLADQIRRTGQNARSLPGVQLASAIAVTSDFADLSAVEIAIVATPAQHLRGVMGHAAGHLPLETAIVIAAKGIERGTLATMPQVAAEILPGRPIALLTGPSFAREVAEDRPTAVVIAGTDGPVVDRLVATLGSRRFRPYASRDPIGAAIGGAVKNVIAIACGISDGRALGDNTRAALVTRGLAEMMRLGLALGGRAETLAGLAGLGDLTLTCTGAQSRNFSLGVEIGRGRSVVDILATRHSVAEGASSAAAVLALAARHGVAMPITEAVAALVDGSAAVEQVIDGLLDRPFRCEFPDEIL